MAQRDGQIPEGGRCPATGKLKWSTRRKARQVASQVNPGEHMSAYRCEACRWFHIGHIPRAVVTGELERADISTRPENRTKGAQA